MSGSPASAYQTRQRYERACAAYLAGVDDLGGSAARTRLVAALGTLLEAGGATGTRDAGTSGTADTEAAKASFDALLRALDRALAVGEGRENALALDLSEAAVTLRPRSRGAWRQRGRALEATGQLATAVTAYEAYVSLEGTEERYMRRVALLGEQRDVLEEAVGLLGERRSAVAEEFAAAVAQEWPLPRVRTAFTAHLGEELATRGAADPNVRRLAALYSTHSRLLAHVPSPGDATLTDTVPFGVHDLRGYLAGRTVCVVQGAVDPPPKTYDVVVRCDALPPSTGTSPAPARPLHVHATTGARHSGWDQYAELRLVLDESARWGGWQESLRALVPGAQRYTGDASLRRPLSDPALLGENHWGRTPSTAFVMLRLLDFLDVNPRIDLIHPSTSTSLRPEEHAWLSDRAGTGPDETGSADDTENTGSAQTRISLR